MFGLDLLFSRKPEPPQIPRRVVTEVAHPEKPADERWFLVSGYSDLPEFFSDMPFDIPRLGARYPGFPRWFVDKISTTAAPEGLIVRVHYGKPRITPAESQRRWAPYRRRVRRTAFRPPCRIPCFMYDVGNYSKEWEAR